MRNVLLVIGLMLAFVAQADACKSVNGSIPEGTFKVGYSRSVSLPGRDCTESIEFLGCEMGQLVDNFHQPVRDHRLYSHCEDDNYGAGGQCIPGQRIHGYSSSSAPCAPDTAVCLSNGTWNKYVSPSCDGRGFAPLGGGFGRF